MRLFFSALLAVQVDGLFSVWADLGRSPFPGSMFRNPAQGFTVPGYTIVSGQQPSPGYGTFNPGPTNESDVRMDGIFGSGSVFGEQLTSTTDGQSYNTSTSPEVATIAVKTPDTEEKHYEAGTLVYLLNSHTIDRRHDIVKDAILSGHTLPTGKKVELPAVAVTDFVVYPGRVTYIPIALQYVANVSVKNVVPQEEQKDFLQKSPGERMFFGLKDDKPVISSKSTLILNPSMIYTRRLTFIQQPSHISQGTVPMDIGAFVLISKEEEYKTLNTLNITEGK